MGVWWLLLLSLLLWLLLSQELVTTIYLVGRHKTDSNSKAQGGRVAVAAASLNNSVCTLVYKQMANDD